MIKKPGAFSNRYMSNPSLSPFSKDKYKENRSSNLNLNTNLNGTMEGDSSLIKNNQINESKCLRSNVSTKRLIKNESKLKLEW